MRGSYNTFSKNSFMCLGGCGIDESVKVERIDEAIEQTLQVVLRDGFDEDRIIGLMNEMLLMLMQFKPSWCGRG